MWIYDLNRGTATRLTGEGESHYNVWTPDGRRVIFGWSKSGIAPNLYWQASDGSSAPERLTTTDNVQSPGSVSPDGTTLAFVESHAETGDDIYLLDLRSRRVTPFLNSQANEWYPEFSPDGRWIAYTSDESGRQEVYVRPFPGPGGRWQISSEGGGEPLWARNVKKLFYRSLSHDQVWVVDVQTDGGFSAGKPRLLFKALLENGFPNRCWDISPDGRRFLMVEVGQPKPQPVTELILVQNWFEELKRVLPTK